MKTNINQESGNYLLFLGGNKIQNITENKLSQVSKIKKLKAIKLSECL